MSIGKSPIELYGVIGYEFSDLSNLENAMTHSSYSNELRLKGISYPSNERLESSPRTQRIASEILDLPLPLGPTITVAPRSKVSTVLLGNDLNPCSSRDFKYICFSFLRFRPLLRNRLHPRSL